jgi:hypothetical protein
VRCEIGISSELQNAHGHFLPQAKVIAADGRPLAGISKRFNLVLADLRTGNAPVNVIFPTEIKNVRLGFVAKLTRGRQKKSPRLHLDIEPRIVLPSRSEFPLTEFGFHSAQRLQARRAHQMEHNQNEIYRLVTMGQRVGRFDRYSLWQRLYNENEQLRYYAQRDDAALEEISKFWFDTAVDAAVSVRFVAQGMTMPAEVTYTK